MKVGGIQLPTQQGLRHTGLHDKRWPKRDPCLSGMSFKDQSNRTKASQITLMH